MRARIPLDQRVLNELDRERALVGAAATADIILQRVDAGLEIVAHNPEVELHWCPIVAVPVYFEMVLPDDVGDRVVALCAEVGFSPEVVLATFASIEECRPDEVVALDGWADPRGLVQAKRNYLRTEPGRGHIYRAIFEVPGYQLAFINLVARRRMSQGRVVEHAILALAQQVLDTGEMAGYGISREAYAMAKKMVAYAARFG